MEYININIVVFSIKCRSKMSINVNAIQNTITGDVCGLRSKRGPRGDRIRSRLDSVTNHRERGTLC